MPLGVVIPMRTPTEQTMKINIDDLKQLAKSCRLVARQKDDNDLFNVGYLIEALEDPELFEAINEDVLEETGGRIELTYND